MRGASPWAIVAFAALAAPLERARLTPARRARRLARGRHVWRNGSAPPPNPARDGSAIANDFPRVTAPPSSADRRGSRYISVYSGPDPPSGGVRRPPLAVIAPHCTQFDGASCSRTQPSGLSEPSAIS